MTTAALSPVRAEARPHPVLAIALTEGRRMLLHPAFLVGVVLTVLSQWAIGGREEWAGDHYFAVTSLWAFLWTGTFLAAALVAGRQRWLSNPDLFAGTPVAPSTRVLGLALAVLGPVLVSLPLVGATAVKWSDGFVMGEVPWSGLHEPGLVEWLQKPLLVALAGVVGILIAQLPRGRLPVLLVTAVVMWFTSMALWMLQVYPLRQLHPSMLPTFEHRLPRGFQPSAWRPGDPPLMSPDEYNSTWREARFDLTALGWHSLFLAGLGLLALWGAMRLADGRDHHRLVLWVGGALALAGGALQLVAAGR
jgi:hypothetical protein